MKTIDSIRKILATQAIENFIGFKEDECFEAKTGTAYDLISPIGRYELAKDVSSLANTSGGYLILGLKTVALEQEQTDQVSEITLFKQEIFSSEKYLGIINEYVHPQIENLEAKWIESKSNVGLGLACIFVPEQLEEKKYFVIKRIIEDGKLIKGIVFGICQRIGSSNVPLTGEQLHHQFQQGKSSVAERLTRIEEKLDLLRSGAQQHPVYEKSLHERIDELAQLEIEL